MEESNFIHNTNNIIQKKQGGRGWEFLITLKQKMRKELDGLT